MEHFLGHGAHPRNNAAEVRTLATCQRCGDDKLGWKKSSRTGRWYLADVQACDRWATRENPHYKYFVLATLPHKCPARSANTEGN
ncbi:hypothetical protein [Streptomyces virginiae]|uniref:hypothetical protein n=1 Tax=Streptomyces virginiae TaxID=1961 RepID=UPI002F90CF29|nr:hypothetical protein OG253_41165 [Streptomyces virginiae]